VEGTVQEERLRRLRGGDTQGDSQMVGDRSVVVSGWKTGCVRRIGKKEQSPSLWWELETGSCPLNTEGNQSEMALCHLLSCMSCNVYQQVIVH